MYILTSGEPGRLQNIPKQPQEPTEKTLMPIYAILILQLNQRHGKINTGK